MRPAVVTVTLAVAALLAWGIVRPAIGDWLAARAVTIEDLERAVSWDRGNPDLRLRLGTAYLDVAVEKKDLAAARLHLAAAVRQRPTDGYTWLRLAVLADRDGQRDLARRALQTALRLDENNVGLRWEAALLQLSWDERTEAIRHFRYVLEFDPTHRQVAFQLLRSLVSPGERVENFLPSEPDALTEFLIGGLRDRDVSLAQAAWDRRAAIQPPMSARLQRRYIEFLLEEGQGAAARRAWGTIVGVSQKENPADAIWNGSFENEALLGWGLDWHVAPVWGVDVQIDRAVAAQGHQSLRLAFNSFPTLDFAGVHQPVPVEAGREYRLRARVKTTDFVTRSGFKLEVVSVEGDQVLGATPPIAGTSDWTTVESRVQIPRAVNIVHVRLRREKAPGPEGNLGGKVWVDDVSLTHG